MTDSDREWVAERAAILEFDGGMTRAQADRIAVQLWQVWSQTRVAP